MSRHVATYITNTHPVPLTCGLCHQPIVDGQGAYVRQDGKGGNHTECPPNPYTGRVLAWSRKVTDPCEANTPGCCINHMRDHGGCDTW